MYIHTGQENPSWEIEWAQHMLRPLFTPTIIENTHQTYGSVRITTNLYNRIEDEVNNELRITDSSKRVVVEQIPIENVHISSVESIVIDNI